MNEVIENMKLELKTIIKLKMNEISKIIQELKDIAIPILTDENFLLGDRWDIFCNLPVEILESSAYIEHFDVEEKYNFGFSWYDDFNIDRYQTVVMKEIVESFTYMPISERIGDNMNSEEIDNFINDFKEEILQKRLYSFINDW